jgi:hypothetical protein
MEKVNTKVNFIYYSIKVVFVQHVDFRNSRLFTGAASSRTERMEAQLQRSCRLKFAVSHLLSSSFDVFVVHGTTWSKEDQIFCCRSLGLRLAGLYRKSIYLQHTERRGNREAREVARPC